MSARRASIALNRPAGKPHPVPPAGPIQSHLHRRPHPPLPHGEHVLRAGSRRAEGHDQRRSRLRRRGDDLSKVEAKLTKLKRGKNKLVAEYTSPTDGDAIVRLLWSSKEFMPESVPPTMLTHDAGDVRCASTRAIRDGRTSSRRCVARSATRAAKRRSARADAMAELSMDAPNLADAGSRLNAAWMTRWISDPKLVRP
jgi:hypothetical protein